MPGCLWLCRTVSLHHLGKATRVQSGRDKPRMPSIRQRHNVHVSGQGTVPMMFAHGFGCDQNMWRYVAPAFERDYKVILFDYLGHGQSDCTAYDASRYDALDGYA